MARATPPVATARAARAPRLALLPALAALRLTAAGAGPVPGERGRCSAALGFSGAAVPMDRSGQGLRFCAEHHGRTCCEGNHTREALVRYAPFSHSASGRCGRMTRLAMCSPCDGDVGTGLKSQSDRVVLCPDFCARWFDACRESFYEAGRAASALSPCGQDSLVCSRLGEITEDPRGFCESIGPYVVADGGEPDACYDGVPAASSRGRGPKA
ncbi:unnamed protein product [Prorocentrum cordatum]|uniref:Folate receptor-like domain-containing protein n=2 Tax=Prorocentrum cordatum TaxID=2364126 RepID=A0ABN9PBJ8_9DINO|nr:unnamed protein product [Polarella glacialis]